MTATTECNQDQVGIKAPHEKEWEHSPYPIPTEREPLNTLRVMSWVALGKITGPSSFMVTNRNGKTHAIVVDDHTQQVLRGLMNQPLYSSALARISEYIRVLKAEHGVEIHTERYASNGYGVYFLVSKVELIDGGAS